MENKEVSLEEYLEKLGFDQDGIDNIMTYANNDIDKKSIHEKIDYLISIGLSPNAILNIIEEDLTFVTVDLEAIKENVETLQKYLNQEEYMEALELTPELLTMNNEDLEKNIKLIGILYPNIDTVKIIIQDRGEILTYKPDYLSKKLEFFINNGLKDRILNIIIENIEVFDLENDEIDIEELK